MDFIDQSKTLVVVNVKIALVEVRFAKVEVELLPMLNQSL